MEQFPLLGSGSKATTLFYLPLASTPTTTSPAPPPPPTTLASPASAPSRTSFYDHERGVDTIKAKIMSHPHYPALLRAFIDCQKVGAPPEVVGRLSALAGELKSHPGSRHDQYYSSDPELDQFMEAYCNMLVKCREELTRPTQEAAEFIRSVEAQLNSLAIDEKCEAVGSSEEDQEASGEAGDVDFPEMSPCTEDQDLKNHLLNKYSAHLSSLWKELSKKKKKGKLPKDSRQKLLHWWQLHYRWPYPSEMEKAALAESTGLDMKQINNWFINQRKRHWKPTEDMQFAAMDGSLQHPHNAAAGRAAAALYMMEGRFIGESMYRLGP